MPVSIDLESGYGSNSQAVGDTISRAIAAGAIVCNLEDSDPSTGLIRTITEQQQRLCAAQDAVQTSGARFFINAHTDLFLQAATAQHDTTMVSAALERAQAYADSGATAIFVPGLVDPALIGRVVKGSPLPVNVMVSSSTPTLAKLAELGVARVSHGPGPFRSAMKALEQAASAALLR